MAKKDNGGESEGGNSSRFAYFGNEDEEPLEGGVRSVAPKAEATGATTGQRTPPNRPHPSTNGIPGPEERLLDISELVRTIGMRYVHKFRLPPGKEEDFEAVTPIAGEVSLTNSGAALVLRGKVKTTLRLECGRCLAPIDEVVEAELEEEFDLVTSHNAFRQEEVHAVDEDTPASVIKGNILDLADLLRQNLLLEAPLQPLCREDCPGILLDKEEPEASAEVPADDNPLRKLGEMLEAKRKSAGEVSPKAGA